MARTINFKKDIEQKQKMSISDVFDKFAKQGMSYHDVAVELGYSESTIRVWSKKMGIKLKTCYQTKQYERKIPEVVKNTLSQNWIKRDINKCQEKNK